MGPRTARFAAAILAAAPAAVAIAQTTAATALPPQNYGSQPGFFRSAPEMQALSGASAAVPAPAPAPAPAATPAAPAAPVAVTATPTATVVAVTPERIPDPTQNLQWTERQMDRAESGAVTQREPSLTTPQPVAPGAYNGQTDPATR